MLKLTDKQRKQLAWEAQSELARRSYRDYVVHVHLGNYKHFRHTEYIADRLEPIARGKQKYMFIEMPPRHGKSMTVTESFPSYYLSKNPSKRVIAASYSDTLAKKFGRLNRSKLEEYGLELFGVSLSQSNSSQSNWDVAAEDGGMISTGIGGSITGQGADLQIIETLFKNAR
ncbi:terminase large subunit domain-containing protein [Planococcus rifietoensis]|uniref:terminase large subunit domain-containing protein n=1 Tax=Planococcus rifietoensis TaxID=200991 RepID=UPI0038506A79